MEKIEVAKGVAEELWATEKAIDAAIAQAGDLVATMIQARRELNLSAVVGAEAQTKIIRAMAELAEARAAVVDAHGDMAVLKRKIGLGAVAFGHDPRKTEDDGPVGMAPEAKRLRVAS